MTQESSGSASEFVPPASMDEARTALAQIKVRKKELGLEKKEVSEEIRQLRAEYSTETAKRATAGKGVGALLSKDLGKASKKVASVRSSYARKNLAEALEPLEQRRSAIEEELIEADRQKLEIEKWMSAQKAKTEQKETATKETATEAPRASEIDARLVQIEQLANLKERGILTEEEFQAAKQRVLDGD